MKNQTKTKTPDIPPVSAIEQARRELRKSVNCLNELDSDSIALFERSTIDLIDAVVEKDKEKIRNSIYYFENVFSYLTKDRSDLFNSIWEENED